MMDLSAIFSGDVFYALTWAPLIGPAYIYALAGLCCGLTILSMASGRYKQAVYRLILAGMFGLVLLNPQLQQEQRSPVPDIAVVVVDHSLSQQIGDRMAQSKRAQDQIMAALQDHKNIETRLVYVGDAADDDGLAEQAPENNISENKAPKDIAALRDTKLLTALQDAMNDIPPNRRAGAIIISDGQAHDMAAFANKAQSQGGQGDDFGPVHVLLSGSRTDKDRLIVMETAPTYGIVGHDVAMSLRIIDHGNLARGKGLNTKNGQKPILSIFNGSGDVIHRARHDIDQSIQINLPITHAGQNVFEIEVTTLDGELSPQNNKTALVVNGVRDRLKVLLISGQPHPGERVWRNLLTSDPAVDLVHFTILREPHKLNNVPQNELSLIPFPFQELFEVKLYDFDLIIFDRYRASRIMPKYYFENIVTYVQRGGALLEASGPSFAMAGESVFDTALSSILPSIPTGDVISQSFTPQLSELGQYHPVTQNLRPDDALAKQGDVAGVNTHWGKWLRQVGVIQKSGDVIMNGVDNTHPLLILDRVGDGRVAHLTSDVMWLWARGYDGGGPQSHLLRRLAHWLMKEPELEEDALLVSYRDGQINVKRRFLRAPIGGQSVDLTMIKPDGNAVQISMNMAPKSAGLIAQTALPVDQLGLYRFKSGDYQRVVLVGDYNVPEWQNIIATSSHLTPLVTQSGGDVIWLEDGQMPRLEYIHRQRQYAGYGWIGLRQNNDYIITGLSSHNIIPDWMIFALMISAISILWWREGKSS